MLKSKPKVEFNDFQNRVRFEGIFMIKSYWEEDEKIINKVKDFIRGRKKLVFEFAIFYLDSVSRKIFFEMFVEIKDDLLSIPDLTVKWYFDPDDDSIYELGELLTKVLDIPFEFIKQE